MMLRIFASMVVVAALLLGASRAAVSGNTKAARQQLESSLQVSGTITVAPDGSVKSHTLDPPVPLGEELTRFLDTAIGEWRFEPVVVEGRVVTAKVPMHIRLVARSAGEGKTNISIASTYFGSGDARAPTDAPSWKMRRPPVFPEDALYMGGRGTVYLLVQVGRDGKGANVAAEQVNLRVLGTLGEMEMLRNSFTRAALRAAKRWTFVVPSTGEDAEDPAWVVRVPVDFLIAGEDADFRKRVGWDAYVPGPRNTAIPWIGDKLRTAANPDALPNHGIYPLREGAKLLTPPAT